MQPTTLRNSRLQSNFSHCLTVRFAALLDVAFFFMSEIVKKVMLESPLVGKQLISTLDLGLPINQRIILNLKSTHKNQIIDQQLTTL